MAVMQTSVLVSVSLLIISGAFKNNVMLQVDHGQELVQELQHLEHDAKVERILNLGCSKEDGENFTLINGTRELLRTLQKQLEDAIKELQAAKEKDEKQIEDAFKQLSNCTQGTPVGSTDSARSAHENCRKLEGPLHTDKKASCKDYHDTAAALVGPPHTCPMPTQNDHILDSVNNAAAWGKAASESLTPRKQKCEDDTAAHETKKQTCNQRQSEFETAVCQYCASEDQTCDAFKKCYNDQLDDFYKVANSSQSDQKIRFDQFNATTISLCFVGRALEDDPCKNHTNFTVCRNVTINYPENFTIPTPGGPPECDDKKCNTKPCESSFLTSEYTDKDWYAAVEAFTDRCTWCTASPTPTPAR